MKNAAVIATFLIGRNFPVIFTNIYIQHLASDPFPKFLCGRFISVH